MKSKRDLVSVALQFTEEAKKIRVLVIYHPTKFDDVI